MNHCTCLVVGALCMFKWLPCFALLRRKSGNACCNHFFLQKNSGHALPCGSSSSHALNYSLSPTCGTASIGVHQPCTKLLRSRVTVDYTDRSAAVMPNEPSNHKTPSFPAVSWTDEATIILKKTPTRFASPSSHSSFHSYLSVSSLGWTPEHRPT